MTDLRCKIITTHYLPLIGGAQTVYDAIARNSGGCVSVLTASRDYLKGSLVEGTRGFDNRCPYSVERLPALRTDMPLAANISIFHRVKLFMQQVIIRRKLLGKLDVIEGNTEQDIYCIGSLDALGWLIKPIQKRYGKKVILYTHGEDISQRPYDVRAAMKRQEAIKAADHIIAVSEFTKQCLISNYCVENRKISILKNGVHFERFQNKQPLKEGTEDEPITIISVGRLIERKGFDALITAFKAIVTKYPNSRLRIIGDGPYKPYLHDLIDTNDLQDKAHLVGTLNESELIKEYHGADIFAMPNRTLDDGDTEGFGLVFLEAAAACLAIIGGKDGGVPSAIEDGKTGLLVDGSDEGDISMKLTTLLEDKTLRQNLAMNAYNHAHSQDWKSKAEEFRTIVEKVKG